MYVVNPLVNAILNSPMIAEQFVNWNPAVQHAIMQQLSSIPYTGNSQEYLDTVLGCLRVYINVNGAVVYRPATVEINGATIEVPLTYITPGYAQQPAYGYSGHAKPQQQYVHPQVRACANPYANHQPVYTQDDIRKKGWVNEFFDALYKAEPICNNATIKSPAGQRQIYEVIANNLGYNLFDLTRISEELSKLMGLQISFKDAYAYAIDTVTINGTEYDLK